MRKKKEKKEEEERKERKEREMNSRLEEKRWVDGRLHWVVMEST